MMTSRTRGLLAGLAAALLAATGLGAAPATEAPARFVQRLFAVYADNSEWWANADTPAGRKADEAYRNEVYANFYDPAFVKLMDDNGALAGAKNAGADLDYDPVCQCQDLGGVYRYVSGAPKGSFFDASVTSNAADQKPWTLVLQKTSAGWRLYDVVDTGGSVRTRLTRHNACLRKARTETQAEDCIA
ncbi:MAG TPA: hypothetical protein VN805_00175 [Caulobacteraceae bacterium]|nr:hypothetical protein [Caulobacteraceae bacterium]